MIKILFVCHGNICRSPMAEFILKHMVQERGIQEQFYIRSCATSREEIGNDMHYGTKRKLDQMQIPYQKRAAIQLTPRDYEKYDYLLCMDSVNIRNCMRILRKDPESKVKRLLDYLEKPRDIADPWYTGNFDETYRDIVEGCEALLQYLGF